MIVIVRGGASDAEFSSLIQIAHTIKNKIPFKERESYPIVNIDNDSCDLGALAEGQTLYIVAHGALEQKVVGDCSPQELLKLLVNKSLNLGLKEFSVNIASCYAGVSDGKAPSFVTMFKMALMAAREKELHEVAANHYRKEGCYEIPVSGPEGILRLKGLAFSVVSDSSESSDTLPSPLEEKARFATVGSPWHGTPLHTTIGSSATFGKSDHCIDF